MNKKITIRDVAQAAGVSISTVHQALNDKPGVSEVTREHIRRIADDLGYRPNKMASGLKRRTQRVAVLLPDEVGRNRFYYPPLWQGVRDYAFMYSALPVTGVLNIFAVLSHWVLGRKEKK